VGCLVIKSMLYMDVIKLPVIAMCICGALPTSGCLSLPDSRQIGYRNDLSIKSVSNVINYPPPAKIVRMENTNGTLAAGSVDFASRSPCLENSLALQTWD
jgi:hypothetical protein